MRPFDKQVIMSVPGAIERIEAQSQSGLAYTCLTDDDEIIVIGGVSILWDKVGAGWVISSDLFKKYPIWTHRTIKNVLDLAVGSFNLHRIESIILANHDISLKWARRLGFHKEGLLNKYDTEGNDYYLMARIE